MQGQGSAAKIGERYRWGATPGKNAGAGQCSKKLERAFGKMQGQGSAVKNWRALPLGATLFLWENARAGQCSKRLASAAGGLPHYLWEKCKGRAVQQKLASVAGDPSILQEQGSAVKIWRALPLKATPVSLGKTWEP